MASLDLRALGEKLQCSICLNVMKEPVTLCCSTGHAFCAACIGELLYRKQRDGLEEDRRLISVTCPCCHSYASSIMFGPLSLRQVCQLYHNQQQQQQQQQIAPPENSPAVQMSPPESPGADDTHMQMTWDTLCKAKFVVSTLRLDAVWSLSLEDVINDMRCEMSLEEYVCLYKLIMTKTINDLISVRKTALELMNKYVATAHRLCT